GNRQMIELQNDKAVTRRKAVELAAAVATFGVAMGIRPVSSMAQGKLEGKGEGKGYGKFEGKGEGKREGKEGKREGKSEGKGEGKFDGNE
ncbi:MAG: hypothetical protein WBW81_04210, partial [Methylocella sp.]